MINPSSILKVCALALFGLTVSAPSGLKSPNVIVLGNACPLVFYPLLRNVLSIAEMLIGVFAFEESSLLIKIFGFSLQSMSSAFMKFTGIFIPLRDSQLVLV